MFVYAAGNLAYTVEGRRVGASASAATTGQYYSELSDTITRGYSARVGTWFRFSSRTRLTVDHDLTYTPAFQNAFGFLTDPFGGLVNEPSSDVAASDDRWLANHTRLSLNHTLSRRSTIVFDAGRQHIDYGSGLQDQVQYDAGVRYTRQLTASFSARLGYRYTTSDAEDNLRADEGSAQGLHTIDAGIDFNRGFEIARRTTLQLQSGSVVVSREGDTQLLLIGNATLTRLLGRTGSLALAAGRNVDFVDGLRDPVISDSATVTAGGAIGRHVRLSTFATALRGQSAVRTDDSEFTHYRGGGSVALLLGRRVTWTNSYVHQEADFADADLLVPHQLRSVDGVISSISIGIGQYFHVNSSYSYSRVGRRAGDDASPRFDRQTVTVSLATALPLYATVRK
jgi:hypothetical protein